MTITLTEADKRTTMNLIALGLQQPQQSPDAQIASSGVLVALAEKIRALPAESNVVPLPTDKAS